MVDPDLADLEWSKNTDPKQAERSNGQNRGPKATGAPDYLRARYRREHAEASMAELRASEMAAGLVEIARVRLASTRMVRMLRDSLLGVPARLGLDREAEIKLAEALRLVLDDAAALTANDLQRLAE